MIPRYCLTGFISCAVAAALILIFSVNGYSSVLPEFSAEWLRTTKLRGAYFGDGKVSSSEISKISTAGMNTILVKFGAVEAPLNSVILSKLKDLGNASRVTGVHFFVVFDYRKGPEILEGSRREVDEHGRRWRKTPCPIDPKYWKRWVSDRAKAIAAVSRKFAIEAIVIDIEMYGAEQDHRSYARRCYCEDCFREFLKSRGEPAMDNLPLPANRLSWIQYRGFEHDYDQWLENRVRSLARDVEYAVHEINPDLMLGGLGIDRSFPFEKGMISGLGTIRLPALCFTELSYDKGFGAEVEELRRNLEKASGKILFSTGFNIASIPVEHLAEQAFVASTKTDGYWIWSFQHLLRDIPSFAGYQLRSPRPSYWSSLLTANTELDRFMKSGGVYLSSLKIRAFDPLLPILSSNRLDKVRLSPSCVRMADRSSNLPSLPRLHGYSAVYTPVDKGREVKVRITNIDRQPLLFWRNDKVHYAVFGADGSMPEEGLVPTGESRVISWVPAKDGVYSIAAEARQSAYQIEVLSGQPFGFKATEDYPLNIYSDLERLFFCVPDEAGEFSLFVRSRYRSALRKTITVFAPDGLEKRRIEGEFAEWTEIRLPVSGKSQSGPWSVKTEGIADKFSLYLSKNISQIFYSHSDQPLREDNK